MEKSALKKKVKKNPELYLYKRRYWWRKFFCPPYENHKKEIKRAKKIKNICGINVELRENSLSQSNIKKIISSILFDKETNKNIKNENPKICQAPKQKKGESNA